MRVLISSFFHPNLYAYQHNISFLMGGQNHCTTTKSELWHLPTESNVKLNQFPCAAEVMLKGEAESFHMLLKELRFEGVALPDLGAFIFKDEITLDDE